MAFTETQRATIRHLLGWSARFWQIDSRLEGAISAVGEKPESQAIVETLLAEAAAIKPLITAAYGRLKATQVGSISLAATTEIAALRSEGRRITGQIAASLGVPVRHDIWSSSSPGGGDCNVIRHG